MQTRHLTTLLPGKTPRIITWACIGVILLAFELYVSIVWITGPNFVPTDTGIDVIPELDLWYLYGVQILATSLGLLCGWVWIVRPWLRLGRMSTDGMLAVCCWTLVFYDPSMNYTVTTVLYNSYAVNMGAWTQGSWPSWTSPNGHLLPEPLLVTVPGYLCFVFFMAVFPCWLLNKIKARYPGMGFGSMVLFLILGVMIMDTVIEIILLRTGVYAYPAGIREVTLFAGKTYQFPLTEALTFGGAVSVVALIRYFVNDKGQTYVEKGVETLKVSSTGKQCLKMLALFGFVHFTFLLIFVVPNQWLGTHGDPYPEGYPSYMINDMCKYGDSREQCPGPGISMPRPENNPW